ncbi:probable IZH3 Implicated in Zinc Homeostasis, membran protein [Cephalotrichum gorgonifer]|uniref:Probable IZH3 Implicated in Zinc Homeostasis, membran protein n=1 Tax=Cephalotrichum gorgonifer TaxID=2041049 RepID=A0AAE8MQ82_9PEZI|nr:probable IZH3 Implicated in Zinc Homeostasis, membran protein [Cephalotrichum gorgonifer]
MDLPSDLATMPSGCSSTGEDVHLAAATGADPNTALAAPRRRRRHSFFIPRRKSIVTHIMDTEEGLLLKVSLFLADLERRLEILESEADLKIDESISKAFTTLQDVRARCSLASGEVIGAGRRRLQVMVETLESRYNDGLAAAEGLNEKATLGIEMLDSMLTEFENRAYKLREQGLANAADTASTLLGEGRHAVNEGLERAREAVDEGIERAIRAAESLEEHIAQAVARARVTRLIHYDDLPKPWKVNPHIRKGYRFLESKSECIWSAFKLSNELVNIWSHALGFLVVLSIAFYFYPNSPNFSTSTKTDIFIATVFFFTACLTLVCSTIWHTMNAVADVEAISMFACVDYTGISVLIAASIVTTEWTAFYCDPLSRWVYMSITAVLGTGGVILPWNPRFNGPEMVWVRVAFYVGLGATGGLPILQLLLTHGSDFVIRFYLPIGKSVLVYLVGAIVYASKVPERWSPGMFDYVGGSHNLWHFAVLGGILFHYLAMQEFFTIAFQKAEEGCPMY